MGRAVASTGPRICNLPWEPRTKLANSSTSRRDGLGKTLEPKWLEPKLLRATVYDYDDDRHNQDPRSNNVAKGIPHCKQRKKKEHIHVQRWQQHKSLKTGQRLSGSRVVHPFISTVDGFGKPSGCSLAANPFQITTENFPRRLKKPRAVVP